jgi:hypothetical protein
MPNQRLRQLLAFPGRRSRSGLRRSEIGKCFGGLRVQTRTDYWTIPPVASLL